MGEFMDDDLTLILESILKRVVSTHNELFGSSDLVKQVSFILSFTMFQPFLSMSGWLLGIRFV